MYAASPTGYLWPMSFRRINSWRLTPISTALLVSEPLPSLPALGAVGISARGACAGGANPSGLEPTTVKADSLWKALPSQVRTAKAAPASSTSKGADARRWAAAMATTRVSD